MQQWGTYQQSSTVLVATRYKKKVVLNMIRKTPGTLNKVNIGTKLKVFDGSHMAHWPEQRQQLRVLPTREPGSPLTTPPQPAGSLAHKWAANAGTCPKRATISAACQYFLQCSINTTAAISKSTCHRELQAFVHPQTPGFLSSEGHLVRARKPHYTVLLDKHHHHNQESNIWGQARFSWTHKPFQIFSNISKENAG